MAKKNADILLIYPGERVAKPRLPMSVLAIASHCIHYGYRCKIVDERVSDLNDEDIYNASIIGISTMSGMQLKSAIRTANRIRKLRADIPTVWGGAHPSAYPKQTALSPLVDFVVKGEGEDAFLKLSEAILDNNNYFDLPAVTFKSDGQIVDNPTSDSWIDMDKLQPTKYELLDIRSYADFEDGLSYESSRGCPFRCTFCYAEYFHKRKWRGKSADKVVAELKQVQDDLGVKKLFIVDDNFFANKKRSFEIFSKMNSSDICLEWIATARADFLSNCSDESMDIIRRSNCAILAIGAESGSERILERIKKGITPRQVVNAVEKCVFNNIMPAVSFMVGLPFEEDVDLKKTLDLYDELIALGKNVEINGVFIYVPYAGTPLFETARKCGYEPRKTLSEWSDWNFSDSENNPWLEPARRKRIEAISSIARFKYLNHRFRYYSDEYQKQKLKSPLIRAGFFLFVGFFARLANWRWRNRFFGCAFEWTLWRKLTYRIFKFR